MIRMKRFLVLGPLLSALLFATAPALATDPASTPESSASDDIATSLLSAMKGQNYAAAFAMFDPTMQSAVSEAKLRAVWSSQLEAMGALTSYSITDRAQAQGLDIRKALLKFERGELMATVAVHP